MLPFTVKYLLTFHKRARKASLGIYKESNAGTESKNVSVQVKHGTRL
jgi:hypothetical protein